MKVYVALNSVPDYNAGGPTFKSVHNSFEGAKKALYPDHDYDFVESHYVPNTFNGPDGFGMIKIVEVLP